MGSGQWHGQKQAMDNQQAINRQSKTEPSAKNNLQKSIQIDRNCLGPSAKKGTNPTLRSSKKLHPYNETKLTHTMGLQTTEIVINVFVLLLKFCWDVVG